MSRRNERELRCGCGSLMARLTPRGIELKCRRCKRVIALATDVARSGWVVVPMHGGVAMKP